MDKIVMTEQPQSVDFLKMAVFVFMSGNTDWSVQYTPNVKFMGTDSIIPPFPVP
jgi:hypothetical protein